MTHLQEKLLQSKAFQDLLTLQHMILTLTNENISDALNIIKSYLSFRKTKSTLRSVFSLISYISDCRPEIQELSCKILSQYLEEIKIYFTKEEIFQIFPNRKYQLFLLRNNVLDINDITNHYHNNQQILTFFTQNKIDETQLSNSIKKNDISKFQEIVSKTNLPLDSRIAFSITDSTRLNNNSKQPTLLEYSVAFSALEIVKFIILNEEMSDQKTIELYKDIGRYAIFGGNPEIIHLLEQNHLISDISIQKMFFLLDAISYHQNEIVEYLIENYHTKFNFDNFSNCLQWRNFQCFYDHIDLFLTDIYQLNIYKQSLLIFASQSGIIEIVECLLSYKDLNINNQDIYVKNKFISLKKFIYFYCL